jgi:nucleotide-binding universal stress UspA family protein
MHEAVARGAVVQAVTSWRWDDGIYPPYANSDPDQTRERAERTLHDEIATLGARSAVTIAAEVVEGMPAAVLCRAATGADLLVLGSHGHGRLLHTVLGSVAEECIRNAPCPVVVIPVDRQAPVRTAEPAIPA